MMSLRRYAIEHLGPVRAAVRQRFPDEPVEVQEAVVAGAASPHEFARGPLPDVGLRTYLDRHASLVVRTARRALDASTTSAEEDAVAAWSRALDGGEGLAPRAVDAIVLATQVRLTLKPYFYWVKVREGEVFGAPKHAPATGR